MNVHRNIQFCLNILGSGYCPASGNYSLHFSKIRKDKFDCNHVDFVKEFHVGNKKICGLLSVHLYSRSKFIVQ